MLLVFLLKYKLHPEPSSFNFFFSYGMAVKNFLDHCSLEDRIQLMQSLKGLDDIELKDEYFGHLPYLDTLDKCASPLGWTTFMKRLV